MQSLTKGLKKLFMSPKSSVWILILKVQLVH